jgi:hypothetical protein
MSTFGCLTFLSQLFLLSDVSLPFLFALLDYAVQVSVCNPPVLAPISFHLSVDLVNMNGHENWLDVECEECIPVHVDGPRNPILHDPFLYLPVEAQSIKHKRQHGTVLFHKAKIEIGPWHEAYLGRVSLPRIRKAIERNTRVLTGAFGAAGNLPAREIFQVVYVLRYHKSLVCYSQVQRTIPFS